MSLISGGQSAKKINGLAALRAAAFVQVQEHDGTAGGFQKVMGEGRKECGELCKSLLFVRTEDKAEAATRV